MAEIPNIWDHWVVHLKEILWKETETTRDHLTHLLVYPWGSYATDGYVAVRVNQGSTKGTWKIPRDILDQMAKIKGENILFGKDGTIAVGPAKFRAQPLEPGEAADIDRLFDIQDNPAFRIGFSLRTLEKLLKVAKRIKAETRKDVFLLVSFYGPEKAAYVQIAAGSPTSTVADALVMPIKTESDDFQDPKPWAPKGEAESAEERRET